jgi:hypothetical protein
VSVFACAGCGAVLTAPVAEVALPVNARQRYGHHLLPALMEPGTYAVDPEPSGWPWRPYEEVGARVAVPAGAVAGVFRPSLDLLLPSGPPVKSMFLAGPGLPAATSDIAMVPRHPQTGEAWPYGAGDAVPLTVEVWTYLAFHDDRRLIAVAGGRAGGAWREALPALVPYRPFRPDWDVFLDVLARLPEVREPWLRAIYDRVRKGRYSDPFL